MVQSKEFPSEIQLQSSFVGPIMVLVASITNKKKRKENPKKERKEEREREKVLIVLTC